MDPRKRFKTDPVFRFLVMSLLRLFEQQLGSGAGLTPTEVREASGLAWQFYAERHVDPIIVRPPESEWPVSP